MTATRMLRTTGKALGLLLTVGSILLVSSQALGGPVSMVTVQGSSMAPVYRDGDLVLVRRAEYRPGDVVAYRSPRLRAIVLHRIVRADGDRFVFRGDNNGWLDPDRPARPELVGKHMLRVPLAGNAVAVLRTPRGIGVAAGWVALFALARAVVGRRRGRTRGARPRAPDCAPPSPPARRTARGASLVLGGGAAFFVALSAAAFILPSQRGAAAVSFEHTGRFGYSARVSAGPVYEGRDIMTGAPVYLKVAPSLNVSFTYRFRSDSAHAVEARGRLLAEVADDTGWKRTIEIQPASAFEGDQAVLDGRLDLQRVWGVIDQVQGLTGIQTTSYGLTIFPELHLTGMVGGKLVDEHFSPRLPLRLDRLLLRPAPAVPADDGFADEPPPDPFAPSQPGAVKVQGRERPAISLGGLHVDAAAARGVSILGALACLLGLAFVIRRSRSAGVERVDEASHILRRHRQWIVPVAARASRPKASVVDVTSIEGLLRLADRYGRMILHENGGHGPAAFFVEDEGTAYRYVPGHAQTVPGKAAERAPGAAGA